jgi:hypothetical protein
MSLIVFSMYFRSLYKFLEFNSEINLEIELKK